MLTVETRSYGGTLLDSVPPFELLGGGQFSWPAILPDAAYCKFDIVAGSSKRIRAQAVYVEKGGAAHPLIAVPAR